MSNSEEELVSAALSFLLMSFSCVNKSLCCYDSKFKVICLLGRIKNSTHLTFVQQLLLMIVTGIVLLGKFSRNEAINTHSKRLFVNSHSVIVSMLTLCNCFLTCHTKPIERVNAARNFVLRHNEIQAPENIT